MGFKCLWSLKFRGEAALASSRWRRAESVAVRAYLVVVEAVVVVIVIIDLNTAAISLLIAIIVELQIAEHAFPVQPLLGSST